jgi:acyl-CoA thioesterase-2
LRIRSFAKAWSERDTPIIMPSLKDILTLEADGPSRFASSANQINRGGFLFGGQLVAQALLAAAATVQEKRPHSLQVSFEKAVRGSDPIVYEVHDAHEGRRVSTRRVTALQNGATVLAAAVSFNAAESGFEHQSGWRTQPPPPGSLMPLADVALRHGSAVSEHGKGRLMTYPQVEIRPIDVEQHLLLRAGAARSRFWVRAVGEMPTDAVGYAAVVSYLSDYLLINAALIPHVADMPDQHLFVASLNHSMWFHAEVDPSQWLLYEIESPWAGSGRALCCGRLFTQSGALVASVAQEAMIRRRL